ncbi:hypothetical protein FHN55_14705 [Streptomyces sp. NP160]|uniref:hypothetical protein n=1 Tax=Streptomyces sp. NP160 TaxID=2586637 RepID=UPI0011181A9D|nr:hypothetical protein [Streptomyces sp. NP160]TNM64226.1 hypothetical protein FHN55_14705 [Streptomyces sp. NP160]
MQPERAEQDGDVPQPRLSRRGVLALTVLGAATLVAALVTGALGAQRGDSSAAPYGVAGCQRSEDAAPVDVAVRARALDGSGSPVTTLGGADNGLQVGASVRDLAGYAARAVAACEVVQVTVYLHDAADGSVPGSLQRSARPLEVDGEGGRGRVVAVDWRTWEASLPESARGGDLQEQASWLVTLVDPAPGTYRLVGRVSAVDQPSSSGDVEVFVEVVPHGG